MSDYLINTRKSYDDLAVDSRLLHEPITKDMLSHEPYTPESVDSHSPNPDKGENEDPRRNSVTPEQLLSRLEKIANSGTYFQIDNKQIKITRSQSQNVNMNGRPKEENFRARAMSEIPPTFIKARLIPTASVQSTLRLQSHHSSSDEEWFEFEDINNIKKRSEIVMDVNENDLDDTKMSTNKKENKKNKSKSFCCCSVM